MALVWCNKLKTAQLLKSQGLLGAAIDSDPYQKGLQPYLTKSATARKLMQYVEGNKMSIRILFFEGDPEPTGMLIYNWVFDNAFADGAAVLCNVKCRPYNVNGTTMMKWLVPWEIILLHEFGHAAQYMEYGETKYEQMSTQVKDEHTGSSYAGDIEHDNLRKWEYPICEEVQYPKRSSYGLFCFKDKFTELHNKSGKMTPAKINWAKAARLAVESKTLGK